MPHFGTPRWMDHLRSGVRDQSGQHGETPALLKIQKLVGSPAQSGHTKRNSIVYETEVIELDPKS
ncbi:hypothetical protein AAY473_027704, partial [Plecturocebus cupreus]